jgi:hypothetical protein
MAIKNLGLTVKNNLDTNSLHAILGQLNHHKTSCPSFTPEQVEMYTNIYI